MEGMLADFFDIRKDSRNLFEGLKITQNKELYDQWMNQYPVLFITLKDVEDLTFADAYEQLEFVFSSLCVEPGIYLFHSPGTDGRHIRRHEPVPETEEIICNRVNGFLSCLFCKRYFFL